jgi:prolyl-tRNA synthetase
MFLAYLKTFQRLELSAIPMAADTGPIGGNLSHEFVILAESGESKIFADKKIFDIKTEKYSLTNVSLKNMRNEFEKYYAVTDDKFNNKDFESKVLKNNRLITKGIEVGHIFYFGDKYSKALKASVDLQDGKKTDVKMGSYGIGVSRLVGAIIEAKFNNNIMKWPYSISPFDVAVIPMINKNDDTNLIKAENIYNKLKKNNIDVLLDDTDENISSKLKKFDLIGVPYQIILGKNSEQDLLEFKEIDKEAKQLSINEIIKILTTKKK